MLPNTAPVEQGSDQAERRHLTVMFCDLVNCVGLSTSLDPEDYREILSQYLKVVSAVAQRFSGYIGQVHGDGMLVYFGYPKSREDSAVLAMRAGLGMLRAMQEFNAAIALRDRDRLEIRIGVHTGLLVVGELGHPENRGPAVVVGKVPNLAARLQALAQPGNMVISGETWRLVRRFFRCEALGKFSVKGIADSVAVYRVEEEILSPATALSLTGMIGREAQLASLREGWNAVSAGGAAQLTIAGEAGIGKSRLIREFLQEVERTPHQCLLARGSAQSQSSAFHPLLEMLRQRLGLEQTEPPEEQLEKIERFAAELGFPPDETLSLLAEVLSIRPATGRPVTILSPALSIPALSRSRAMSTTHLR